MARAFVAGATGYTGREVVRLLCERGADVVAHVRPDSSRLAEWRERFGALSAAVDSTAWDPEAMTATLRRLQPDVVFALLGTTRERGRRAQERGREESYETVDYGLTALLLHAARASGGRPRFVYLSAVGVRAGTHNEYLRVRWRVEQEIRRSGLPFVIARPAFITGPDRDEDRPLERWTARAIDGGLALLGVFGAGGLRDRYRSMTGRELARGLVRLALDPAAENSVAHADDLRG